MQTGKRRHLRRKWQGSLWGLLYREPP